MISIFTDSQLTRALALMQARSFPLPARVAMTAPAPSLSADFLFYSLVVPDCSSSSLSSVLSSRLEPLLSAALQRMPPEVRLAHAQASSAAEAVPIIDLAGMARPGPSVSSAPAVEAGAQSRTGPARSVFPAPYGAGGREGL